MSNKPALYKEMLPHIRHLIALSKGKRKAATVTRHARATMERDMLKIPRKTLRALLELAEKSSVYTAGGNQWAVQAVADARDVLNGYGTDAELNT